MQQQLHDVMQTNSHTQSAGLVEGCVSPTHVRASTHNNTANDLLVAVARSVFWRLQLLLGHVGVRLVGVTACRKRCCVVSESQTAV